MDHDEFLRRIVRGGFRSVDFKPMRQWFAANRRNEYSEADLTSIWEAIFDSRRRSKLTAHSVDKFVRPRPALLPASFVGLGRALASGQVSRQSLRGGMFSARQIHDLAAGKMTRSELVAVIKGK